MHLASRTLLALALATVMPARAAAQDAPPTDASTPPAAGPEDAAENTDATDEANAVDEAKGGSSGATTRPAPAGTSDALDIDALRRDYLSLRDRLFQSRARAAAVASALYSTRVTISLGHDSTRFYSVTRATVRLDGANVFDDAEANLADRAPRFEGYIAPGRHTITVRIEAVAKDDDRFATTLDNTFTIVAPGGKDLRVDVTVSDDGDIASSWNDDSSGSYRLHLNAKVRSVERKKASASASERRKRRVATRR